MTKCGKQGLRLKLLPYFLWHFNNRYRRFHFLRRDALWYVDFLRSFFCFYLFFIFYYCCGPITYVLLRLNDRYVVQYIWTIVLRWSKNKRHNRKQHNKYKYLRKIHDCVHGCWYKSLVRECIVYVHATTISTAAFPTHVYMMFVWPQ